MKADNSVHALEEFAKMLAKLKEDGNISHDELMGNLRDRIDELVRDGESLEPLSRALQQQMPQSQQMTITEWMLEKKERGKLEDIIDKLESKD